MKKQFYMRWSRHLLLMLLAVVAGGTSPAWAQISVLSEGFESNSLNGWTTQSAASNTGTSNSDKHSGSYCFRFYYNSNPPQYLISPELSIPSGASNIKLSLYYKNYSSSYAETFQVGYSTNTNNVNDFTWDTEITASNTTWTEYTNTSLTSDVKYIAIRYNSDYKYYLFIDDINLTCDITGPALSVADGETTISSGYNYNFGLATSGTTKTFTLSNPGTEAAPITIGHTGSFGVSPTSTSIPAGESVTLTVTMPEASGSDVITISSISTAIEDFVINVSGTIRDASKMWCNFSEGVPSGWTNSGNYTITTSGAGEGTSGGGYAGETNYSYKLMYSPLVTIADGEILYLKVSGYGGTASWNEMQVRYSADGSSWTTAKTISDIVKGAWTSVEVSEIPAGTWYIGFYGRYVYFTDIYGGMESTAPIIALSQSSYDFGLISTSTTTPTPITITNTGKSELTGLNITSDNANFTVSVTDNATTIAANGGTATFNVTMAPNATGAQSATITVKSDNADDLTFTATGAVIKAGTATALFNDETLAGWTKSGNTSFSTDETAAYFYYSTNTLTSPKLTFVADDFLAVKAKMASGYGYVTVKGSTDGTIFTEIKKLDSSVLNQTDYATGIVSGISTDYKYIQLDGYYCYVKEVAGLTYVAELSVTTGDPAVAVATPAAYDFGECKKNESVTYNFANASSVGTINITSVTITGDGAAAYSTNWTTSVAAPFALEITRTYDITRTGAQNAVVAVTTSEGDFVINVTGTDWAPITTFPWTENFNAITSGIPAGWDNAEGTTTTDSYKWSYYATGHEGAGLRFNSYSNPNGNTNFLKTPIMNLPAGKDMQLKFWYKNPTGGDFSVYISNDGGATYETSLATGLTGVTDWTEKSIGIPSGYTDNVVIVFKGTSNYGNGDAYIYLDDVTMQEQEDGANFAISNNANSTKDFGRVNPNSVQEETYTITNSGNQALEVTFTDATDFIVVKGNTEPWNDGKLIVPAKNGVTDGTASFTVKMVTDGTYGDKSGDVVLNFTALNATSFTIPLKGHVIDPTILYVDFEDNKIPETWQKGADWTTGTANSNTYAVQTNTSTASALVTNPLTVGDGENLTFKVARNMSGSSSYKTSLKTRYSADGGASWSEYTNYAIESTALTEMTVTNLPTGTVIVEFFGSNIKLDDIQGVNNATKPAIAITEEGAVVANGGTKEFGILNVDGTATYTVKNIGNAPLKAAIAGDGVTVSPANIEVAAGETADITMTMACASPYGAKAGKMTIDSEDEWISDFVVNFTAELVDPTEFVEDFAGNAKPAGWYSESWNYANGVAYINVGTAKPMITELVGAEAGKNTLSFDAKFYYDYGTGAEQTLSVYTSTDRKNWTEAKTVTLTGEVQKVTLDALADGNFYVKFEAANATVDNIKGVKKLDLPEHDLYVSATTLPTGTPFIDTEFTATATVASLIAAEEGVYAKLFIDNTAVATADAANIAANGATTFSMTCTLATAGEHSAYIEVYYSNGNVAFTTLASAFEVVNYPTLVLDESSTEALSFTTGTYDITLKRTFVEGWNTICLPFEVSVTDIHAGAVAYSFDAYNTETGELTFNKVTTTLSAATPYVIYVPEAIVTPYDFKKQAVNSYYATAGATTYNNVSFRGTYAPVAAGGEWKKRAETDVVYGVTADGHIRKAGASASIKGFRAYFTMPAGETPARLSFTDEATGITKVMTTDELNENVYNLNGQKVQKAGKGLYIINGKKVVMK